MCCGVPAIGVGGWREISHTHPVSSLFSGSPPVLLHQMHACCMHPRMRRLDMGNASNQVFFGVLMLALCTAATSDNAVTRTHSTTSDDVSSPPIILWSSSPVAPGDTLLLATSGACVKPCTVNITVVSQSSSPPVSLTLTPAPVTMQ